MITLKEAERGRPLAVNKFGQRMGHGAIWKMDEESG